MSLEEHARNLAIGNDPAAAMGALLEARDDAVPHLIGALDLEGGGRRQILLILAALRAREALLPLCERVTSGKFSPEERVVVSKAVSEMVDGRDAFDDRVKEALIALSHDGDATCRSYAARGLRNIGDLPSEERLKELAAKDSDANVKKTALDLLVAMREERGAIATGAAPEDEDPLAAFAALAEDAEEEGGEFRTILSGLRDMRFSVRDQAAALAMQADKEIIPHLIELLSSPSIYARMGACQALRVRPSPDASGALVMTAHAAGYDADGVLLQTLALKALANCLTGAEEGIGDELVPLARQGDPFVRAGALICLGRIGHRMGVKVAVISLDDEHSHVQEAAAIALSEGARPEDTDLALPLLALLSRWPRPSAAVTEAILVALSRIDLSSPPVKVRARHRVRRSLFSITAAARRNALALLEQLYDDDDPPPIGVVDDVLSRLHDPEPDVRLLAASFLSRFVPAGMPRVPAQVARAIRADSDIAGPRARMTLEILRRHDTPQAKRVLEEVQRAGGDPATFAHEFLEGFEPKHAVWIAQEHETRADHAREIIDAEVIEDDEEIVEAKFEETIEFTDDEGARLDERLHALKVARAEGRVRTDEIYGGLRDEVLERFAAAGAEDAAEQVDEAHLAKLLSDDERNELARRVSQEGALRGPTPKGRA